jgi:hypothetical protein
VDLLIAEAQHREVAVRTPQVVARTGRHEPQGSGRSPPALPFGAHTPSCGGRGAEAHFGRATAKEYRQTPSNRKCFLHQQTPGSIGLADGQGLGAHLFLLPADAPTAGMKCEVPGFAKPGEAGPVPAFGLWTGLGVWSKSSISPIQSKSSVTSRARELRGGEGKPAMGAVVGTGAGCGKLVDDRVPNAGGSLGMIGRCVGDWLSPEPEGACTNFCLGFAGP